MEKIDISNEITTLANKKIGYFEKIKARKFLFIWTILWLICILSILGYYLFRYSIWDSEAMISESTLKETKQEQTQSIRDILNVLSNKNLDIISLRREINKFEKTINKATSVLELDTIYSNYLDMILANTEDLEEKSRIYTIKWIAKIAVWSKLYYSNTRKYTLALMSNYNQAIEYLDNSIKLKDYFLPHQYKWFILLDEWVNNEWAIKELKRAIELNPNDYLSYYYLWNAYEEMKKYDIAISYYLSGISINDKHDLSIVNLWNAYIENWDFKKKNDLFESYNSKCLDYCNILYLNQYNDTKNYVQLSITDNQKFELLNKAIESSRLKWEINRDAYRSRWRLYYINNQNLQAIDDLILSLNDPNDPKTGNNVFNQNTQEANSFYLLGRIYFDRGLYEMAKKYLIKWKAIMPSESSFQDLINQILDIEDKSIPMLKTNNTKDENETSEILVS